MNRFEKHFCKIKIITPIHIGSGNDYYPFDYVIKENRMHFIDRDIFIEYLELEGLYERFLELCSGASINSILRLRSFIHESFRKEFSKGSIKVTSDVCEEYNDKLKSYSAKEEDNSAVINWLQIKSMVHPGTDPDAIVPGSSIKGAIRTAVLDHIVMSQKAKQGKMVNKNGSKDLEKALLELKKKNNSDDPFRSIKFSDFEIVNGGSYIDRCLNMRKESDSRHLSKSIPVNMEFFIPDTELFGTISIDTDARVSRFGTADGLTWRRLLTACSDHFVDVYKFEKEHFNISVPNLQEYHGKSAPIKIGAHSGAYAVTLKGYREGKIYNRAKKKTMDHQNTTWVASGKQVGWAILQEIEESEFKEGVERAQKSRRELQKSIKSNREKYKKLKIECAREIKKSIEHEENKRKKAELEKERLKSLSPDQWASEVVEDYAKDYNEFCDYIQTEENHIGRRKALARSFFIETLEGRKKLKAYKKKLKKGTDKKTILIVKELLPDLFEKKK